MNRRQLLAGATVLLAAPSTVARAARAPTYDAYVARECARLGGFAAWLSAGGHAGKGLVGEYGWPNFSRAAKPSGGFYERRSIDGWNKLGARYLEALDFHGFEGTYWAAGEHWGGSYNKLAFSGNPVSSARPAGQLLIDAAVRTRAKGINVAQNEFEIPMGWPTAASVRYLASRGIRFLRVPFKWEALQGWAGEALDPLQLASLKRFLEACAAARVEVILDCHNYGLLHGSRCTGDQLADLWLRIVRAVDTYPAVAGYGLMNEPNRDDMGYFDSRTGAADWERTSQAAATAIRKEGSTRRIYVMGFQYGPPEYFTHLHPAGPWIADPAGNTFYETHHYFDEARNPLDDGGSSRYEEEYSTYLQRATAIARSSTARTRRRVG